MAARKPETTVGDIETIRRLIDLVSFTNNETLLAAKFRADEAIDRIEADLRRLRHIGTSA